MIRLAFLLLFTTLRPSTDHAIYISIVEINYSSTTKSTDLRIKVFTDDLQDVLRNYSTDYIPQPKKDFISNNTQVLENYFKANLKLEIDGTLAEFMFVEAREENDAHFLTFSITENQQPRKSLTIEGKFFTELFPDQSNVVNLRVAEKKYFARLTKSNPSYTFTFD